jgi:hypothetical protein
MQSSPVEFALNPFKDLLYLLFGLALLLAGCSLQEKPELRTYLFVSRATGSFFRAQTHNERVIQQAEAELRLPPAERRLFPNGPIARGDGGHNAPWSWHFVPNQWELTEVSIELCDATPEYVEAHLSTFIDTIGRFCPWSAVLVRSPEEAQVLLQP